ncbi:MAG: hypothetical protein HEQ23_12920 [Tepidisphaera sp.]
MSTRATTATIGLAFLLAGCGTRTPVPTPTAPEPRQADAPQPATPAQAPAIVEPSPTPPAPPTTPQATPKAAPPVREVFPGVRLDIAKRAVEFDGEIARGMGQGALTYLEVLACRPNTREHESVVMAQALPSHLHAALLLAGALPGKPGSWTWDNDAKTLTPHPPAGDALIVTVAWEQDGTRIVKPLTDLVQSKKDNSTLTSTREGFVFAGSAFLQRRPDRPYAADVSGTLIGLCTFGDEPVAWTKIISHEESVEDPAWTLSSAAPPAGTKVIVRIELPADAAAKPAR